MSERPGVQPTPGGEQAPGPLPGWAAGPGGGYSSTPFTFPSARRLSMIFWAMWGGTGS
jgi:hypothetical protein